MSLIENNTINTDPASFLRGGGEMGAFMRAYNWAAHPLGRPEHWPQSLKANIRLLLNAGFPMFIWWSRELYAFHNDAYLPALGDKHPQALGTSARVIWAEIWEQLESIVTDILNGGDSFYTEGLQLFLIRRGFLEETYWSFSYSAAYNDAGEEEGIFCACYDVTKTVLGQRRLKSLKDISEALSQIQTIKQACQLLCAILNENKNDVPFSLIYLLNEIGTEAQLLGQAGNVIPVAVPQIIDLTQPGTPWPLAQVQQTRQMLVTDFVARQSFSQVADFPEKAVIHPIFRPGQDHVIGFFVCGISNALEYDADYKSFIQLLASQIAISITNVQTREEMLRQQEYLKNIFQQSPVGIVIVRGPQYIIDLANPSVCEIWGRRAEDVIGKSVLEALPEISDQGIIPLLDGVVHTETPFVAHELPLLLERNGILERIYLNFLYHPMRDARGVVTGVIAVAIDISEQVKARHEIEAMNKELLGINADLDNFVYAASHDLKAPISNIEGLMEALVEYLPTETVRSEMVQRVISLIQGSIERFKRTVTDLTQVAKIQREAGEDVAYIDLAEVITEVRLDFESMIIGSGARIETNLTPGAAAIQFSAKNMRSIIYNLLSNALKYCAPNRPPHIKITTEDTPEYVILSVADNGLGVNLADKNKMFSMFKRLHNHVEGTGIGLYIVKRIVENAGGQIEVESQIGVGSTFKIYFKR